MTLRLITAPLVEPITLAEAKLHLRVSGADEDGLLALYITAARQACEERTERALITQTWEQALDAFPTTGLALTGAIELPRQPVQSITSVQYVPAGGTALVTLDPAAYTLDAITAPGWVLSTSGTWPATAELANCVRVQFVAGYGAAGSAVPGPLRAWVLLTLGTLYANREAIDNTGKASGLPDRFYDSLLDPYRNYTF